MVIIQSWFFSHSEIFEVDILEVRENTIIKINKILLYRAIPATLPRL